MNSVKQQENSRNDSTQLVKRKLSKNAEKVKMVPQVETENIEMADESEVKEVKKEEVK